jgi:hypothetical protein
VIAPLLSLALLLSGCATLEEKSAAPRQGPALVIETGWRPATMAKKVAPAQGRRKAPREKMRRERPPEEPRRKRDVRIDPRLAGTPWVEAEAIRKRLQELGQICAVAEGVHQQFCLGVTKATTPVRFADMTTGDGPLRSPEALRAWVFDVWRATVGADETSRVRYLLIDAVRRRATGDKDSDQLLTDNYPNLVSRSSPYGDAVVAFQEAVDAWAGRSSRARQRPGRPARWPAVYRLLHITGLAGGIAEASMRSNWHRLRAQFEGRTVI